MTVWQIISFSAFRTHTQKKNINININKCSMYFGSDLPNRFFVKKAKTVTR